MDADERGGLRPSAVPRFLLAVLLALITLLVLDGALLGFLHPKPSVAFLVLSRMHVVHGVVLVPLGLAYLAAHLRRLGASRLALVAVPAWAIVMFGVFSTQIPLGPSTFIGVLTGVAGAAWFWWRSTRRYAWQSFATALLLILAYGGIIDTGFVMARDFPSMRTNFYHWAHLILAPVLPLMIWVHLRAREAAPSRPRYRLPRFFYQFMPVLIAGHAAWYAYRAVNLTNPVPPELRDRGPAQAHIRAQGNDVVTRGALPEDLLQPSGSCAECHVGLYRQWHGSAHRFASETVAYQRAAEALVSRRGRAAEGFCAMCHNPVAVAAGAYARGDWPAVARYAADGVSCEGCHLRQEPSPDDGRVSARFLLIPDTPFPWAPGRDDLAALRADYLNEDAFHHRQKYFDDYLHSAGMCGACHGERHPSTSGGDVVLFDQFTAWERSGLGSQGISCQKCHMNLDAYMHLPEGNEHARPDHRFPGMALDLPESLSREIPMDEPFLAEDLKETAQFVRQWLDGEQKIPDYERVYLTLIGDARVTAFQTLMEHHPALRMEAAGKRGADGRVSFTLTTWNTKAGHDFPAGPPDLAQYWLETLVRPPGGTWRSVVGHDPTTGAIDARAPRLGGRVTDSRGGALQEHAIDLAAHVELWNIPFGRSVTHDVALEAGVVPPGSTVAFAWLYRRYDPEFSRWAWRDPTKVFPAQELARIEVSAP